MTLIVGIKCQDGIVMAADSAATYATPLGSATVQQKCTKLTTIGNLVIGTSGPVGLGQSYREEVDRLLKDKQHLCPWKSPNEAKSALRDALWKFASPAWENCKVVAQVVGSQACNSVMSSTMIALPIAKQDSACLIQFDHMCCPEHASEDLPFCAIGSGQVHADPFLAFMRRVIWSNDRPSLQHGVFYAFWAVSEAIKTAPGGLSEPIQVWTLSKDDAGTWVVRTLSDDELGEHQQALSVLEPALKEACTVSGLITRNSRVPMRQQQARADVTRLV